MGPLLDIGYLLATLLTLPWFVYRMSVRGDWRGFAARFGARLGDPLERSIWLHGSSAGEISLLGPLIERLERDMPGTPLVISAYSSTGYAAASRAYARHRVIFFPFDLTVCVYRFLRHFDPRLVVIMESEFWPNFLLAAQHAGIPVVVLNGKISDKSFRVHAKTRLIPSILRHVSLIAVQYDEHATRLNELGIPSELMRVTGNMKYDLAKPPNRPERAQALRASLAYTDTDVVIIGGSLHEREDEVLIDAYEALTQRHAVSMIIVPRYPAHAARVEQLLGERGYDAVRKTEVDRGVKPAPGPSGVLIVDTIGELRDLYSVADIAFVGGSLFYRGSNKGGHNLMEPAILGLPVLFGPYNFSFEETARALVEAGGGCLVHDRAELEAALSSLLSDGARRRELGERARAVVLDGQGATQRNYELLLPLLSADADGLPASCLDRTMPRAATDADSR